MTEGPAAPACAGGGPRRGAATRLEARGRGRLGAVEKAGPWPAALGRDEARAGAGLPQTSPWQRGGPGSLPFIRGFLRMPRGDALGPLRGDRSLGGHSGGSERTWDVDRPVPAGSEVHAVEEPERRPGRCRAGPHHAQLTGQSWATEGVPGLSRERQPGVVALTALGTARGALGIVCAKHCISSSLRFTPCF